jgi:hypothetical protein
MEGFQFVKWRAFANKRLDHTRRVAGLLMAELREDGAL